MVNLDAINERTGDLLADGVRVLNANLFAETERGHVARLLELMNPPAGACVLDAGCGVGEVARVMREIRPDLTFKLLNLSQVQLDHCPADMERICADFAAIPLADESVDVVMFNYALCQAGDWMAVLREARRVLREGGVLFLNEMSRTSGTNLLLETMLQARAYPAADVIECARIAGFRFDEGFFHEPVVRRLRDVMPSGEVHDLIFEGVEPATWRFLRETIADPVASAFARHERIGFQFSGGRDSTAALYLLKPYWDRLTVYHLDTGDQFPETQAVVAAVEADMGIPMTRIAGNVAAVHEQFGWPSDLVPVDNAGIGRLVSGRVVKLQSRYECCARSLMAPLHERITADGITLIVRGQRDDEYATPPMRSGGVRGSLEVLYPIQTWTGAQVSAYLNDNGLPIAPFYERGAVRAPECMSCTAWWDEGRAQYMERHHPKAFEAYEARIAIVRGEINRQYAQLEAGHTGTGSRPKRKSPSRNPGKSSQGA